MIEYIQFGMALIQIGILFVLLRRKIAIPSVEDIVVALKPNFKNTQAVSLHPGTAICIACNKHVARFSDTSEGPVCVNCKPEDN
jgi:hypothetical protein